MKTKQFILASALACMCMGSIAQETETKPEGKAIIQTFGNFHSGFSDKKDDRGFELERSYVGYQYKMNENLEFKSVMDIGKSSAVGDYQRLAYIKNAQFTWKKNHLTVNGGLIGTTQFNTQEKFWGYRYIYKSFQDQYKFGSSADLGLSASYSVTDWFSADAIIVNGEGYKKVQINDGLLYGLGATFTPVKGLTLRLYGGINETTVDSLKNTTNAAGFVGYKTDAFAVGAEYSMNNNAGFIDGNNQSGVSVFGKVALGKITEMYVRYDQLASKDDWNIVKDEAAMLIGAQFKLGKYMKIAPNFRMTMPKADGADNTYMAFVNYYFAL